MRKRILFFHFDLQGGGAEKVLINLLRNLDPEKYDITLKVIFGKGPNVNNIPKYVHYEKVFNRLVRGFTIVMKAFGGKFWYRLFVRGKYDIEIAYLETSPTRIIGGSTNKNSKKLAWVHTTLNDNYPYSKSFKNRKEAIDCYNRYDKILFVSQGTLDSFIKYLPEVTTPKEVVYNVNDYDYIKKLGQESLHDIILSKDALNICAVGRLISLKGYDRLIRSFYKVKKDTQRKMQLYILGEGEEHHNLEQLINDMSLSDDVHLLGFQSNPYKYMSKMDLFVCSSTIEGYSTVTAESIALGVPVLTTECSGMDEILHKGRYGLIVPNNEGAIYDGLNNLVNCPDMLDGYKQAISDDCNYTTAAFVEKYEQLFDSL